MRTINQILILLLLCLCNELHAQDTVRRTITRSVTTRVKLDTNEVTYDEKGNALRFYQYQKLLSTGEYGIRLDGKPGDPNTKRYLKKMSAAEQLAMYERSKEFMNIPGPYFKVGGPLDINPLLSVVNNLELDNKIIVIIFWNTHYEQCTDSFATLSNFFDKIHNTEKLIVLAITPDDKALAMAKLLEHPLTHTRLLSNARNITAAYELKSYPAFIVTDKDHNIRFATRGLSGAAIVGLKNTISTELAK